MRSSAGAWWLLLLLAVSLSLLSVGVEANTRPIANKVDVVTFENTAVAVQLSGFDPDGDTVTYAFVTNPSFGSASGFNSRQGTFTYTPTLNYYGADTITYVCSDGLLSSLFQIVRCCAVGGWPCECTAGHRGEGKGSNLPSSSSYVAPGLPRFRVQRSHCDTVCLVLCHCGGGRSTSP